MSTLIPLDEVNEAKIRVEIKRALRRSLIDSGYEHYEACQLVAKMFETDE